MQRLRGGLREGMGGGGGGGGTSLCVMEVTMGSVTTRGGPEAKETFRTVTNSATCTMLCRKVSTGPGQALPIQCFQTCQKGSCLTRIALPPPGHPLTGALFQTRSKYSAPRMPRAPTGGNLGAAARPVHREAQTRISSLLLRLLW